MNKRVSLGAKQTLAVGFALIILAGSLILMLPVSNRSGLRLPFLDALFTATSATCVTGLVIHDTFTEFSFIGQAVILLLIQIGGLGFMTISILISMALGKKIGLKERSYLMEAVNSMQISGIVRLVKHIFVGTLIFEIIGAVILFTRFYPVFGFGEGVWFSIFHSVSAFCNAGFDLMGKISPFGSLEYFAADVVVNVTVMLLIICGGLGFIVWENIYIHKFSFKKYNLHTKVMLTATLILIMVSSGLFLIMEWNNSFDFMGPGKKIMAAVFQSVTSRTAGFNTVDTSSLSEGSVMLTSLLMMVGAGPGSTGGGIKVTNIVLIFLSVIAYASKRENVNIFHRRLENELVRCALTRAAFYTMLAVLGSMLILIGQSLSLKEVVFEVLSALGTVGLTTGVTRDLSPFSQVVVVLLMYAGRLGSITVFMAVTERKSSRQLKNPVEKIMIG